MRGDMSPLQYDDGYVTQSYYITHNIRSVFLPVIIMLATTNAILHSVNHAHPAGVLGVAIMLHVSIP